MVTVEGRSVYVRNGSNTQTVNVCTEKNIRGTYEYIFRLPQSLAVNERDVQGCPSLSELSRWLLERGAVAEKAPIGVWPAAASRGTHWRASDSSADDSVAAAHVDHPDLFVSYTQSDTVWAEWIAWQLEQHGYSLTLQAWDFLPGHDFLQLMDRAIRERARMIVVLSEAYQKSEFAGVEWRAKVAKDPTGDGRSLIPVRVEDFAPTGVLASRIYIDLVGLDAGAARDALLKGVADKDRRPSAEPSFPGAGRPSSFRNGPGFPGADHTHREVPNPPTPRSIEPGLWPPHLLQQIVDSPTKSLKILTKLLDRMAQEPERTFAPGQLFPAAEEPASSVNNAMGKLRPHFMAHFGRDDFPFDKRGDAEYRRFSMSSEQAARWRAVRGAEA